MIELRPYQRAAIDALYADWSAGAQRLGVSAATGTGKTVIMAHLAHEHQARYGNRVLILVHRDELVRQTVEKLLSVDQTLSIGVVKAKENRAGAAIVVASIQTVCKTKRLAQLGYFGLIIADEAHRSMADQWQTVLQYLAGESSKWPRHLTERPRVAGFSATWSRADSRPLGKYWQKISFTLGTDWAIDQKFLVKPVGKYIRTDIQLDTIKKTAGEYNDRDMAKKLSRESIRDAIVAGYVEFAKNDSGVCFAPTVDTAEFFRPAFEAAGITTAGLYGITSRDDSHRIHRQHRSGDVQVLFSCTRLAEGWDAPYVSAGIIARPTTHQGLFVQMIGRLLRPFPGKERALVLDPTGVLFKFDLQGIIDLSTSERPSRGAREDEDDNPLADGPGLGADNDGVHASVSGYMDVDLLRKSDAQWLKTGGGFRFIYAKGEIVFLVPGELNTWHVGVCAVHRVRSGRWLATNVLPEQAEQTAARWALDRDRHHASRTGRWRRLTPTQAQFALARKHGLGSGWSRQGALYDAIAVKFASDTLDAVQSWQ